MDKRVFERAQRAGLGNETVWLRLWLAISDRMAGQSTVEYALVGALVVIAAAGALTILGNELSAVFTNLTGKLAGGR